MSAQERGAPWGFILTVATLLAFGNAWLEPFEDADSEEPPAVLMSDPGDKFVRSSSGWAPFPKATLTPGIQTFTGNSQCTTNFVFTDLDNNVYLGQAAHCSGEGREGEESNGCTAKSEPLGTRVTFNQRGTSYDVGEQLGEGTLAYSSWLTMKKRGEKDASACRYNDFALIKVARDQRGRVNPTLPYWGGPTGLSTDGVYGLERAYGYGRSSLRRDGSRASRQAARTVPDQVETRGWSHFVYALSPGIPGDSGSGYLDQDGRALGTLSTLMYGAVLTNGLGDLRKELAYARKHSGIRGLKLELGTAPFHPNRPEAQGP